MLLTMFKKITYSPTDDFESLRNITLEFDNLIAYLAYAHKKQFVHINIIVVENETKSIIFNDAGCFEFKHNREHEYKAIGMSLLENVVSNKALETFEIFMACHKPEDE